MKSFDEMDINKDGVLTYEEFSKMTKELMKNL